GARRNASRQAPTAPSRPPPPRTSSQLPPSSAQTASALSIQGPTGWSADSNPSTSSACSPSPPDVSRASAASISRQLAGCRPDWERARTASAPAANDSKRTPVDARSVGRACTRTQASVITASVPSEPISSRSGDGPAPEPGSRLDSHVPRGVSACKSEEHTSELQSPYDLV